MSAPPLIFDRALLRTRLDRAAPSYGRADFLKDRAAQDAVFRLETIMRDFPHVVDLGARNGAFARALADSDAAGRVGFLVETDLSARMLAGRSGPRLVADEEQLPFGFGRLDLVVSTLSLHWTNDVIGALIQIRRALKPDGLFIGALFGGGTLNELRQSLTQAELEMTGGAGSRAGFALPVADVDRVVVRYDHPLKLLADLRAMGETSVLAERHPNRLTRTLLARAFQIYAQQFADPDGRIRATFEILTLTGWTPDPSQQKPLKPGSAKMRLADALGVVEQALPRDED